MAAYITVNTTMLSGPELHHLTGRHRVSFNERHKKYTVATTAIARELAGWCWSLAVME